MTPQTLDLTNEQIETGMRAMTTLSNPYDALTPDEKSTVKRNYKLTPMVNWAIARNLINLKEAFDRKEEARVALLKSTIGEGVEWKDATEALRQAFLTGNGKLMKETQSVRVVQIRFSAADGIKENDLVQLKECPIPSTVLADLIGSQLFVCAHDDNG